MTTEERAEVNQRALIDKVLARYSGEFTLFRELLQNADDAGALNAEIRFETATYEQCAKEDLAVPLIVSDGELVNVVQWTFKNNGKEFDDGDWKRLPRIAEGNPNPEKIGAFGVGFYSLFSVTDSPCVSSGEHEMQFYWKENDSQLYTRRRVLPEPVCWTTFKMPLREHRSMASVLDLMQFLASSIIFMVKLTDVSVFLDNDRVGYIKKSLELPRTIDIPEEMDRYSPKSIMHVREVRSNRITIEADVKNTCSGAKDSSSTETSKTRVVLTIFTAEVAVKGDDKLSGELCRCIKKKPPSELKYSLIL